MVHAFLSPKPGEASAAEAFEKAYREVIAAP